MKVKYYKNLLTIVLLFVASLSFANAEEHESKSSGVTMENASVGEKKSEYDKIKKHHLLDDHSFTIVDWVSIPLPVILIDEGLHVFMSSAFEPHGHGIAESGGKFYGLDHETGKVMRMDEHSHHVSVSAPFDLSITKNVVIILIMSILMFFFFKKIASSYASNGMPTKAGKFIEPIIIYVRDDIAIPNIGEKHYKKYMWFLLTVFFFIWALNLLGMTPLGVSVTNNFTFTFGLALFTFFITLFTANKNYWMHILWMPGVPVPMKIILLPIELLGMIIKPFSLMIRLYANMTAGHMVVMGLIGLIFFFNNWFATGAFSVLTLALSLLELLVAALQAYIFTMLSAIYFGAAVTEDH